MVKNVFCYVGLIMFWYFRCIIKNIFLKLWIVVLKENYIFELEIRKKCLFYYRKCWWVVKGFLIKREI